MMRTALVIAFLASAACGRAGITPDDAALAASVADRIAQDPSAADTILEAEGLDRRRYDTLLYEIAADPDASRSYVEARREVYTNPYAPPRRGPAGQGTY